MSTDTEGRLQHLASVFSTEPEPARIADAITDRLKVRGVPLPGDGSVDKGAISEVVVTLLESPEAWQALLADAYVPPDVIYLAVDRAEAQHPVSSSEQLFGRVVRTIKGALAADKKG